MDEGLTEVAKAQLDNEALKEELKPEKRLKTKYRNERDIGKVALDVLLKREATLKYEVYEMQI